MSNADMMKECANVIEKKLGFKPAIMKIVLLESCEGEGHLQSCLFRILGNKRMEYYIHLAGYEWDMEIVDTLTDTKLYI